MLFKKCGDYLFCICRTIKRFMKQKNMLTTEVDYFSIIVVVF